MQNQYLIPANANKSRLIFGFFTFTDLIIFGAGVTVSLFLLLVNSQESLGMLIILLSPALICTFLVMPVPHYHNILTLISNIYNFYVNRRRYFWRGWCMSYDEKR